MTPQSSSKGLTHVPVAPLGESQTTTCFLMDPFLDLVVIWEEHSLTIGSLAKLINIIIIIITLLYNYAIKAKSPSNRCRDVVFFPLSLCSQLHI